MSTQVATQREQSPQETLRVQFDKMGGEIEKVLPEHVSLDKFKRVVLTAVSRNPDLMAADRRSLLAACLDAAQDGLIPDGREAALVVFNTKVKGDGGQDTWIKKVQYMPMIYGVYKKVRNAGEISTLSAHVVYANDAFEYWVDEDGPHLRHTPVLSGSRGNVALVYAVCKLKDGSVEIETMLKAEVEEVRAISKSAGGPAWSKWWGEMARKTVVRRLSKRLPMSSDLERLMQRDDSMYDLDGERPAIDAPPRPQRAEYQPDPPAQGEDFDDRYRQTMGDQETDSASSETEHGDADSGKPLAVRIIAPDGPGEIPVPTSNNGDMKPIWQEWAKVMLRCIDQSTDVSEINYWIDQNTENLERLRTASPEAPAHIKKQADIKRGILVQAPAVE